MESREYFAQRNQAGVTLAYVNSRGKVYPMRQVVRHSPSGLEVGYGGSGPADAALTILTNALPALEGRRHATTADRDLAYRAHQGFKWRFISGIEQRQGRTFICTLEDIRAWLIEWRWNDPSRVQGVDEEPSP